MNELLDEFQLKLLITKIATITTKTSLKKIISNYFYGAYRDYFTNDKIIFTINNLHTLYKRRIATKVIKAAVNQYTKKWSKNELPAYVSYVADNNQQILVRMPLEDAITYLEGKQCK